MCMCGSKKLNESETAAGKLLQDDMKRKWKWEQNTSTYSTHPTYNTK